MTFSLVTVGDSTSARVVGTDFDGDPVARENSDIKLTHLAADGRENGQTVVALHSKHRVGEGFFDRAIKLQLVAFRLFTLSSLLGHSNTQPFLLSELLGQLTLYPTVDFVHRTDTVNTTK